MRLLSGAVRLSDLRVKLVCRTPAGPRQKRDGAANCSGASPRHERDCKMTQWPARLVLVGAGKMGGAMAQGWLDAGLAPVVADHPRAQSVAGDRFARGEPRRRAESSKSRPRPTCWCSRQAAEPRQVAPEIARPRDRADARAVDSRRQNHRQSQGAAAAGARSRPGDAQHARRRSAEASPRPSPTRT